MLLAEDIPGLNDVGTKHDEALLPDKEVSYHGQIVALAWKNDYDTALRLLEQPAEGRA